jgi:hypothetical protein
VGRAERQPGLPKYALTAIAHAPIMMAYILSVPCLADFEQLLLQLNHKEGPHTETGYANTRPAQQQQGYRNASWASSSSTSSGGQGYQASGYSSAPRPQPSPLAYQGLSLAPLLTVCVCVSC